jgi:hypothetical protein
MSQEKIDWTAQFQRGFATAEHLPDTVDMFIERAATELEPLHIPLEVIARVESAGCKIKGTHYFTKLYSQDPDTTPIERLRSTFTGSVAHGRVDLAGEAYALLVTGEDSAAVNDDLVDRLNRAIRNERWWGGYERLDRLEAAAKALGKPLHQRVLGGLATTIAMNTR